MEGFKPEAVPMKIDSFQQIREEFKKLSFTNEEILEIFNKKYPDQNAVIAVVDNNGNPLRDGEDKLNNVTEVGKLSDKEKIEHIYGSVLKKFFDNQVDYVKELSKEKEILEMAYIKGSDLKKLVEESVENKEN